MNSPAVPTWLQAALDEYAIRLREGLGSRLLGLRLFGSWARGEAGPDSDVDVWVLVDRRDELTRTLPYDASIEVLVRHDVDLAPTVMDREEWNRLLAGERRLARDILTEGRPL
jgi:uncharacterized protein